MFEKIKKAVINLVEEHKENEVTPYTNMKYNGIYMLYVNDFNDNRVIPFYIGQTVDLQQRHKQHYMELLALNRFGYDVYKCNMMRESLYFGISSYYEGHFKTCKIFKYMVEHNCSLADFHMIVLEENIDTDLIELEEVEQEYFEKYLPAFFGFNQINTISEIRKGITDKEKYTYMISDGRKLEQYIEYGYSLFNYLHAFPKNVADEYPEELNEIIQKLWKHYDKEDAAVLKTEFHNMSEKHDMSNEIKRETSNEIKQLLQSDLEKYFEDNSLKSHDKFKMILEQFSKETPDWEEIKKYLKRYSNDGGVGLFNIIESKEEKHKELSKKLKVAQEASLEAERIYFEHKYAEQKRQYDMIFPQKEYRPYPLKSNYTPFEFPEIYAKKSLQNEAGVCQICIDYTMDKSKDGYDVYTDFLRIAYRYSKGTKVIKYAEYMIANGLQNIMKNGEDGEKMYYVESRPRYSLFKTPFSPIIIGCDTMITPTMEYKTGINEYVIANTKVETVVDVLNEIEEYVQEDTEVILYSCTRGIKGKIEELEYIKGVDKDNKLIKKLCKIAKNRR